MTPRLESPPSIACGIAGWSYPDWNGMVYPPGIKDKLQYVAQYVDMIEINSTFYRAPSEKHVRSWVERTQHLDDFFFTAKIHQDVTHKGRLDPDMVSAFASGFSPMIKEDRLRHLLAQFRYDFADTPDTRSYLERLERHYGPMTNLTLELRHNTWQSPRALDFLRNLNVSVANLDYPTTHHSFTLYACDVGQHAYLRLHGRNTKAWFSHAAGRDETYNYCYSRKETAEIVTRALELRGMSKSLTLVANNHYQGKEMVNALEIKAQLAQRRLLIPPLLMDKYPQLTAIALEQA